VGCQARETADYTGEGRLIEAIAFIDTATSRARSTGIPGINDEILAAAEEAVAAEKARGSA